jgi:hypothetical protein
MYIYMCVYIYICVYIYTYIYIYMASVKLDFANRITP